MPEANNDVFPQMEVNVRPIPQQGNLHGFASVTIGGIKIDDFKIVENKDGALFVGMPRKPDKTSETGYRSTVYVDKDYRARFNDIIISAYHETVDRVSERAAEKPRVTDQMAKAEKEAEGHNAALPPKEKAAKQREAAR